MDKFQVAHEWAMKVIGANVRAIDANDLVEKAWVYADAMQFEADKRNHIVDPTEKVEEWQPDWSVAPEEAGYWVSDEQNFLWFGLKPTYDEDYGWQSARGNNCYEIAPSFNYQGDWRNSLRSRP